MKRLFLLMFIVILLVGAVSATNIKYDNNDMKVNFKKSFLGISTGDLGSIELKSHKSVDEVRELGAGEKQAVMFYDFNGWEIQEDGLGEVAFTNERTGEEIEKDYYFAELVTEQQPKYKTVCENKFSSNGTKYSDCSQVQNGFKQVEVWDRLEDNNIPNRNTRIALITDVEVGDYIDAVWTIAGKKVKKHSSWTQDLNTDIYLYFKFDQVSPTIDSVAGLNTSTTASNVTGKIGNAYSYSGSQTGTTGYKPYVASINEGTYNFWINTGDTVFDAFIQDGSGTTNNVDTVIGAGGTAGAGGSAPFCGAGNFCMSINRVITVTTTVGNVNDAAWHMVTITVDGTTHRMYIDGLNVDNTTTGDNIFGGDGGDFGFIMGDSTFSGIMDEVGVWNRSLTSEEVTQLYNGGDGITFIGSFKPAVNLNSPIDNFNTSNPTINFNGTALDTNGEIVNVSLIIDDIYNETNTSGINGSDYIFIKNFIDGIYNWGYEACDNDSLCANSSSRTFTIDTTSPTIDIESPTNTFGILSQNQNISLNFTATDFRNLDTCLLEYNNTNTTFPCINATKTVTGFDYQIGFNNLTIYANDSINNLGSSFTSWTVNSTENLITFNSPVLEGNLETFTLNITLGSGVSLTSAFLNYNQTTKEVDIATGDFITLNSTFTIPPVDSDQNVTFLWEMVFNTGSVNSSSNNQTIQSISVDNCSSFTNVLYNYTILDEESQSKLSNTTVELDLTLLAFQTSTEVLDFSASYNNTNPVEVCISVPIPVGTKYSVNSTVKYEAIDHAIEYYNIDNFTITNTSVPQEINLFDLKTTDSTEFQVTFKDAFFIVVEGALIQVNRQYVSEGVFKTVEIPKTDSNGQTVAHLVEKDVVYNLIITKGKRVLGTFNNVIAFCQDSTIGLCELNLNAFAESEASFDYNEDIGILSDLDYNQTSRILTFQFSTFTGATSKVNLVGTLLDSLGNNTVCNETLTTSSGTLTCSFPQSVGNSTVFLEITVDDEKRLNDVIVLLDENPFGTSGFLLMLLLVVTFPLMFADSKALMVLGVIFGFIVSSTLLLAKGGILASGSAISWLIVAGVILIWRLGKEETT